MQNVSSSALSFAFLLLTAAMILVSWLAPGIVSYVIVSLLLTIFVLAVGQSLMGNPLAVLINERNLMSLSRFQMTVWTIVVLAAYFSCALARIKANPINLTDALNVQIDPQLWGLLGISTTSLVGSSLVLNSKQSLSPDPIAVLKTSALVGQPSAAVLANSQGTLFANPKPSDARLTDMFEGDEVGNTAYMDLAKLQMFYFTLVSVVCFFVSVCAGLLGNPAMGTLPALPSGMLVLMGISNAGYLTSKGINHTPTN